MKFFKHTLAAVTISLLTACGGGGGGSSASVASTSTFDLRAAYVSLFTTPSSNQFTMSGTIEGISIAGNGTATSGSVTSGTFEGQPSLQRSQTISATLTGNGQSIPLTVTSTDWTDSNYVPRGSTGDEYEVVIGTPVLPTTARVNDTGNIYTANTFQDISKRIRTGTVAVTYVVEADTAATALVKLIRTYRDTNSVTTNIAAAQFRIGSDNKFQRLNETLVSPIDQTNLTVTYR